MAAPAGRRPAARTHAPIPAIDNQREVAAFGAKNEFGQRFDLVEHGEDVLITRHGKEVARLVPARHSVNREAARAALQRIQTRAEARKLGQFDWSEWKTYRNEGRP